MKSMFTTRELPDVDRFSVFRDTIKDRFLSSYECNEVELPPHSRFYANIVEQKVADIRFIQLESNGHWASSRPLRNKLSLEEHFQIELQRSGTSHLTQDGRTAFLRQGDFCIFDMARPVSWSFDNDYSLFKLLIPREKLAPRLGNTQNLTARAIRGNSITGSLVYSFVMRYIPFLDSMPTQHAQQLADILLNLITSAFSEYSIATPPQSLGRSTLFYFAQHYLEQHLSDPDLSVNECANACGISVRYLQMLFKEQNTSVLRWIYQKRLDNYKTALVNPLLAEKNITQLAYECGFSDISNLSRKFKSEFFMTPSEYRKIHSLR
ncbi:TPA: helix-turn-helix domain-containing protein [Proteus mirabilis]|uniref:helix-turn-helix domain-containing protein n=1 Tax=Proteus mirabilis TaxID=584 RepID=UPI001BB07022|nr:helix-turn-helix domain-containing protein [Proteus mirabilis]MBS3855549.1 helix-turn-helix domain-containing protein [Proteus mirabilis]HEK2791129.1 helix-turn-helix domain-containing protein [Proteus mirabilis]HEK2944608.1 helix-turn-helix domain-containing protein [Proteus mirabilis]